MLFQNGERRIIGSIGIRSLLSTAPWPESPASKRSRNTPYREQTAGARRRSSPSSQRLVPNQVGTPSSRMLSTLLRNRTYDRMLGDMQEGNGDRLPDEKATPRPARPGPGVRHSTLVVVEVSVDRHSKSTAAYATDYTQKVPDRIRAAGKRELWRPEPPEGGFIGISLCEIRDLSYVNRRLVGQRQRTLRKRAVHHEEDIRFTRGSRNGFRLLELLDRSASQRGSISTRFSKTWDLRMNYSLSSLPGPRQDLLKALGSSSRCLACAGTMTVLDESKTSERLQRNASGPDPNGRTARLDFRAGGIRRPTVAESRDLRGHFEGNMREGR